MSALLVLLSCTEEKSVSTDVEFRGVWIATVANIDWPLKGVTDPQTQQLHFESLLKFYKKLNYNAIVVQVRTAGDAFYPSTLAPWSDFLTGQQGTAPEPFYDPLEWMIAKAHEYGMEFHAWMNPFRATTNVKTKSLDKSHVYHQHREWMVRYGNQYYINPGIPEAQAHVQACINEVVDNYDIDGIHFDDYFYPYKKKNLKFRDVKAYAARADTNISLEDWRRDNINTFVRNCFQEIKKRKSWVEFGISPFGVWRNKTQDVNGSDTQAEQTNYDDLYADVLTWAKEGWVDYIAPQLYWSMDYELAAFRKLVAWWSDHHYAAKLYIGLGLYKVQDNHDQAWNDLQEIPRQINHARNFPAVQGNISFSAKSLIEADIQLTEQLQNEHFEQSVLTPASALRCENPYDFALSMMARDQANTLLINAVPDYWRAITLTYASRDGEGKERAVIHCDGQQIYAHQLPGYIDQFELQCIDWLGAKNQSATIQVAQLLGELQ